MINRLRIEVASDDADRTAALVAAAVFVRARGVDQGGTDRVCEVLEAMLDWVAQRAYPQDPGTIALQLQVAEGGLDVLISDEGHPGQDFGGMTGPVPAELTAVSGLTRELRQVNLADHGTRLSAVITIEGLRPSESARAHDTQRRPVRVTPGEIEFRDGGPEDVAAIVELIYSSYGLSYAHPDFYRPQWIADQMRAGRVLSTVAVFRGEVIAHHALLVTDPRAAVETGVVVVHPAFRGLGIVSNHLGEVLARARSVAAPAILSRAVTHHPYSQFTERSLGFHTTALMIGAAAYAGHPRSALTMAYLLLDDSPHPVSLPTEYAEPLTAAYANAGIDAAPPGSVGERALRGTDPAIAVEQSGLAVMPGTEVVTVSQWDDAAREALIHALRTAVRGDIEVLYADVDLQSLTRGELDDVVSLLRTYDFFYCGLVLFGRHGHDHLRLQAMLTDRIQVSGLVLAGDFTHRLRDVVLTDAGPRLQASPAL